MSQRSPYLTLSITIDDADKRSSSSRPKARVVWHPLDTLRGVIVTAGKDLTSWCLESLTVRLEGQIKPDNCFLLSLIHVLGWSRTWLQSVSEEMSPVSYTSSYRVNSLEIRTSLPANFLSSSYTSRKILHVPASMSPLGLMHPSKSLLSPSSFQDGP